jgi:hypothetical protein
MTDDSSHRGDRRSDLPPPNLAHERDELVRSIAGRHRTPLSEDAQSVLRQVADLEDENAQLKAQLEAHHAARDLLERVSKLEEEKQELLSRAQRSEATSAHVSDRFRDMENEFSDLASLFVATNQIHSSLVPRRVVRRAKEVLGQLLGAAQFAIFVLARDRSELVPIAWEGLAKAPAAASAETGSLARALRDGTAAVCEGDPSQGSAEEPCAILPLRLDEGPVGLIVVYATLPHKQAFSTLDFELFKLLGQHVAVALAGASLFAAAQGKVSGAEEFSELSL